MINIDALEQALSGIEELGHAELEFKAGSTTITLRMLTPEEEMDVQRYARQATSDVPDDAPADEKELSMMQFLDRFKQQVLAYSITQIDNLDLRDVASVGTGEVSESGKAIHVPKHEAVRKLVEKWKRPVLLSAFAKYGELTERVENNAADNIKYTPTERSAEIERLEKRLADLKRAQAEEAPPSANNRVARQVEAMVDLDKRQRSAGVNLATSPPSNLGKVQDETLSDSPTPDGAPDDEPPVVVTTAPSRHDRQASVSGVSEPTVPLPETSRPEPVHEPAPDPAPAGRRSAVPAAASHTPPTERPGPPEPDPAPTGFDGMMDSMADPFDEDSVAAENARLMAARKQAAAEKAAAERAAAVRAEALQSSHDARNAAEGAPVSRAVRRRTPPHRAAANTADAALDAGAGNITPARSKHKGTIGDKEVYGMPPVTLSKRGGTGPKAPAGKPSIDETSGEGGSSNPRFKGRRRK